MFRIFQHSTSMTMMTNNGKTASSHHCSRQKKISHRHRGLLCGSSSPCCGPLNRRRLNPIKPVYAPDWPDGRLNLTAIYQYVNVPAVLVARATATQNSPCFSRRVSVTIASTHCTYPRTDGQAQLVTQSDSLPTPWQSPIHVLIGLHVKQLH